jgi:tRNA(Arg) A34 adenosine deaminase TadA
MNDADRRHVDLVIEVSGRAREHGNPPFGALLVDEQGQVLLEEENTTLTDNDLTAHPELKVAKIAASRYDADFLSRCTMYASTEPCAMCTTALYNAGIGRVVFALSGATLRDRRGNPPESLALSMREVLARGGRPVEVVGPVAEDEALTKFEGIL